MHNYCMNKHNGIIYVAPRCCLFSFNSLLILSANALDNSTFSFGRCVLVGGTVIAGRMRALVSTGGGGAGAGAGAG
jgi:hypothetical protein